MINHMMKKRNGQYFSYNTTPKPKGFKMVCSNPRTYSYLIPVFNNDNGGFSNEYITHIYIECIHNNTESTEHIESAKDFIIKNYKIENFTINNGVFKRDASYFPVIKSLRYNGSKDDIIKAKKLYERVKKIQQFL